MGDVQLQEFEVTARVKMEEGVFKRKFEINSFGKSLTLCQKEAGDPM
jgi:meiotically up-regulated gene 157 (Mug157) protein